MASKYFRNNNIYKTFSSEWVNYRLDYSENVNKSYDRLTNENWKNFIEFKDLGIVCVRSHSISSLDEYEIIDEKKWALTKIKYGF